jgi:hypothetical protein
VYRMVEERRAIVTVEQQGESKSKYCRMHKWINNDGQCVGWNLEAAVATTDDFGADDLRP